MSDVVIEERQGESRDRLADQLMKALLSVEGTARMSPHMRAQVIRSSSPDLRSEDDDGMGPQSIDGRPADLRCFVDFITLVQEHDHPLPWVASGQLIRVSNDGTQGRARPEWVKVDGLHGTSVQLRCDGRTVTFTGNMSRFNRPDNLWGLEFADYLRAVNQLLEQYDLPPFTGAARVRRIDIATNVSVGTPELVAPFLVWLSAQAADKLSSSTHGQRTTITWGNLRKTGAVWKAYDKHAQMLDNGQCPRATEHARQHGVVRFEGELLSKVLSRLKATKVSAFLSGQAQLRLEAELRIKAELLFRAQKIVDDLAELPKRLRCAARDHLAGMDVRRGVADSTFHGLKRALREYGIDISQPHPNPGGAAFKRMSVRPALPPTWYGGAANVPLP